MACSRGQKILNLLQNTASTSQDAAKRDSSNKEQDKREHIAHIRTEGILNPVVRELPKTSKLEAANNETYYKRLMSLSSNLDPPQELVTNETSTLITSIYCDSSFKLLESDLNDLFTNQQKRTTLASLTNVEPSEVFIHQTRRTPLTTLTNVDSYEAFINQQRQTTLATLNNVDTSDDFLLSPSSEPDPYATDHDSDDPDFLLDNQGNNNVQQIESSDTDNENEAIKEGNKKTRKRKRIVQNWKRNYIKNARNSGKEYVNWRGNTQTERKLKPPCENCRNKCTEKISEEDRKSIFLNFWSLSDINRQRDFISKFTCLEEKKRSRKRPKSEVDEEVQSRRKNTFTYFLSNGGKRTMVCKKFFLNTLNISGQMVVTVFSKMGSSGTVVEDRRGKACKNSLLDESVKNSVRTHINAFDTMESHYCRNSTQRKYLPATLNISKIYSLYLEYCQDNNITKISTESIYRQIFNTEFNLSFFVPKKDLCDTCHNFENMLAEKKLEMEEEYKQHFKNKEISRQNKNNDKDSAKNNPLLISAVFDLQQVLPVPKSNVGVSYYKLKLSTYNFTIYNLSSKECQCFMWNECIARRGSSEIGSCLLKFVEWHVKKGVKEFSFFSDNCSGQNRNKYLFAMYSYLSQKYVIKIRHTFLEPGHTQNEGDCVHSVIERAARNIPIYTPEQWYSVVRTAKRKAPFYTVYELSQKDVFDLKKLQNEIAINFDKDAENRKVFVSKFKILQFDPEFPNCLFFKINYEDDQFTKLNLIERGRRSLADFNINVIELKPLFGKKIPIQKKKYDHLQFLCKKGAITPHYHDYFKQLPFTCKSVNEEDVDD